MLVDIVISARDARNLTTTVSATVPVDDRDATHGDPLIETIVRYARDAAERLREETLPSTSTFDVIAPAREFVPLAAFVASQSLHR